MDPLDIGTPQLTALSSQFENLAEEADSASSGLDNGVRLQGDFWGNDAFGNKAGPIITSTISNLVKGIDSLHESFENVKTGAVEMADDYQKTDEANSDTIPKVSDPISAPRRA
jgi:hypothetical protein